MPFEIYPQSIRLFPEDVQTFALRTSFPPVLWGAFALGSIQSDRTVNLNTGTSDSTALIQHALDGVAGVEWTFDSKMLPTSTGEIGLWLVGAGSHSLRVTVKATQTVVTNGSTTLDTISHTVASGDVYYLEVAGNLLRLYINDTLETEYEATSAVRYPVRCVVSVSPPYASGTPHLTAPRLVGNWGVYTVSSISDTWTLSPSSGGTFDDSTDVWSTVFTASDEPGVYTLTLQTSSSAYQEATATIIVEPLSIIGETAITLQPSAKYTFRTNYDNAQHRLVTWSVVSGSGTFSNGEFTAPSAPGTTVVKAVYSNQEARVTITVPAVMTIEISGGEDVTAATLGEVLTLSTNMTGTINWTASVGTLSSSSGSTVTWTAPNQSQLVALITATNGTYTVTVEIPTLKAFPYTPNRPLKWDRKKTVLLSRAEDRRRAARVKDANNEAYESFELTFNNRNLSELAAVQTFWDDHHPDKRFIFTDSHRSIRKVVYFDSDIAHDAAATCATTYSFRVIEG